MSLEKYLSESKNTHSRERILNYKLFYDLSIASAIKGYELQIYTPETDHEGVDIILDDNQTFQKIQLKTVLNAAKTNSWKIHSRLLKPELPNIPNFGFHFGGANGLEGGVILMEIIAHDKSMEVAYYYCDIHILSLFLLEVLRRKSRKVRTKVKEIFRNLHDSKMKSISIPKYLFVKVKDSDSLLALAGLRSKESNSFRYQIKLHSLNYWKPSAKIETIDKKSLFQLIFKLTDDSKLLV